MKQVGAGAGSKCYPAPAPILALPEALNLQPGKNCLLYCVTRKIPHSPLLKLKLSCVL